MPAVADDEGGLAAPLVGEVVDGVLDGGRVAPVVLRQDEDEGGGAGYFEALGEGVGVRVGGWGGGVGRGCGVS